MTLSSTFGTLECYQTIILVQIGNGKISSALIKHCSIKSNYDLLKLDEI